MHDPALKGLPCLIGLVVGDQAEVHEDHPKVRHIHQHVGRLEISMQLAGRVQRRQALCQLAQCRPEPAEVESRCERRTLASHVGEKVHSLHNSIAMND